VENSDINAILNTSFVNDEGIVILYDLKRELNIYLSELLQSPVRTLADIIAFNNKHAQEVLSV
jgi:amidase